MNSSVNQLDHPVIYRILPQTKTEYIFFLSVHGTFSKVEQGGPWDISQYSKGFKPYKVCSLTPMHLSSKSVKKKKILGSSPNVRKLNDTLLNNPWIKGEIKREVESVDTLNWMKRKTQHFRICGIQLKRHREMYSTNHLYYKRRKFLNQWHLYLP